MMSLIQTYTCDRVEVWGALQRAACVLVALLIATFGIQAQAADGFASTKPTQRVEYWQKREADIAVQLRDTEALSKVKLVFLGDSITDFWQLDDNPWVTGQLFGKQSWDESFTGVPAENLALNLGISGDRTEHVLYRILPASAGGLGQLDAPELRPDVILVLIGVNNTWAEETPVVDSVVAGIVQVLAAAHARKPDAHIVLQSLIPTSDAVKNRDVLLPVNRRIADLAASPQFSAFVSYLDLYPLFADAAGQQVSGYFVNDGVHPNQTGYRIWRDRLVPYLLELRARRP
jgi:lysophospholipase L1-like esterase